MTDTNVAAVAADDDFDVTADLAAAFEAAENDDGAAGGLAAPEVPESIRENRDEKGRFAPKADTALAVPIDGKAASPAIQVVKPEDNQAAPPAASEDPIKPPPPGFSPTAKAVWAKDTLDKDDWAAVKRDIVKRNDEVGKGLAKLTEYKPIEQYVEMARQSGTTLDRALQNYVGIEQELSRDFTSGVARICQQQGVDPVHLANAILARHGASSQRDGTGEAQVAHQRAPSVDHIVQPLLQKVTALENLFQQQHSAGAQTEIQRFASDPKHMFFENVRPEMKFLLEAGKAQTLEDAYELACWQDPEIRELLIKQRSASDPSAKVAAASQARAASRSITGSAVPGAGNNGPALSIEDEVRAHFEAQTV